MKLLPELFVYVYVAVKIPLRFPGNISVLEFFSIESSLKAISSDYGSNKERNFHLEMSNLKQKELHRLKNRWNGRPKESALDYSQKIVAE